MDRAQILEDLRDWLDGAREWGGLLEPQDILKKINELEEKYE